MFKISAILGRNDFETFFGVGKSLLFTLQDSWSDAETIDWTSQEAFSQWTFPYFVSR